jgi:hypothetical protein
MATHTPDGYLAVGHPVSGSPVPGDNSGQVHMNYQQQGPGAMANLTQVAGNPGPLADSIVVHGARAGVRLIDQAAAAGMVGQLGPRRPSGDPSVIAGQAEHTAPSTVGAEFRTSPQRPGGPPARTYTHTPGELQGLSPGSAA